MHVFLNASCNSLCFVLAETIQQVEIAEAKNIAGQSLEMDGEVADRHNLHKEQNGSVTSLGSEEKGVHPAGNLKLKNGVLDGRHEDDRLNLKTEKLDAGDDLEIVGETVNMSSRSIKERFMDINRESRAETVAKAGRESCGGQEEQQE